ncbi:MAG: hypothetical protein SF052_15580 [Bacteroidia bacterium]|nr:hypothetical protein [Bacteroidia bacterium]
MAKKFLKNLKSLFVVEEIEEEMHSSASLERSEQTPLPKPRPNPIIKQEVPKKETSPLTFPETDLIDKDLLSDLPDLKAEAETATPVPPPKPKPPVKKINQEYADMLFKAMQQNNLQGLDYLEFKESLEALSKITADEETRYKSAYAVVSAMGTNVHKLIETARHYVDVLNKAKEKFNMTVLKQMQDKLTNKKNAVDSLEKSIQQKKNQIQKLTAEIDEVQRQMIVEMAQTEQYSETVTLAELEFENTFSVIRGKIDQDIKNMREYLTVKAVNPLEEDLNLDHDLES